MKRLIGIVFVGIPLVWAWAGVPEGVVAQGGAVETVLVIEPAEPVWEAAWSPDETQILTRPPLQIWDVETGELFRRLTDDASGAVWNHDGTRITSWHGTEIRIRIQPLVNHS